MSADKVHDPTAPAAPTNPKTRVPYTDLQLMAKIDKLLQGLSRPSLEWISLRVKEVYNSKPEE